MCEFRAVGLIKRKVEAQVYRCGHTDVFVTCGELQEELARTLGWVGFHAKCPLARLPPLHRTDLADSTDARHRGAFRVKRAAQRAPHIFRKIDTNSSHFLDVDKLSAWHTDESVRVAPSLLTWTNSVSRSHSQL